MKQSLIILLLLQSIFAYDWLQFNGDSSHSGWNKQESIVSISTVKDLEKLFQIALPEKMDGSFVVVQNVKTSNGTFDLLLLTTIAGHIMAIEANTGKALWIEQHGPGSCNVMNDPHDGPCFTTSSPAVDPSLSYVYTYGLDGYIHKHHLSNGSEVTQSWPQVSTLKPYFEKGSSSLTIVSANDSFSYLYATHSAYPDTDDGGDFQGHVTIINLNTSTQVVFNVLCSNISVHLRAPPEIDCHEVRAGVWGRSGVVYSPITDKVYFTSGNGEFNKTTHQWGDTIIALPPNGSVTNGNPIDAYTPSDYLELEEHDLDLGSTSIGILPRVPDSFPHKLVGVQGGKDQQLRLINLENLSGKNGIGFIGGELGIFPVPDYGMVFATPLGWVDSKTNITYLFVSSMSGLSAHRIDLLNNGSLSLELIWKNSLWGSSPLIANDLLYFASPKSLQVIEPITGAILWQATDIGGIHWQVPVVANGIVYIADEAGMVHAYNLQKK